jgi:hypothetical protein
MCEEYWRVGAGEGEDKESEKLPPKIFHCTKSSDLFQMISPRSLICPFLWVIIPMYVKSKRERYIKKSSVHIVPLN